ncbi:MAG: DNA polymerase/3'-5' exonuclease PolX [Gemmatimonadota bacterium]
MENVEIARILTEVADLLEIRGGTNPFRIRAYRNAVHTVEDQAAPLRKLVEEGGDLTELPGIGKDMASHITELATTGRLRLLETLSAEVPRSLVALKRLPGLGPKKIHRLWKELGVTTVEDLAAAAEAGEVARLEGFGEKTQARILEAIARARERQDRTLLAEADEIVAALLEHLRGAPETGQMETAGSYRRRRETVGDIDILVAATDPGPVMERFTTHPSVREVERAGDTRATVHLASGLQVDLRVVPPESYGAALVYFTGSKEHNITLRKRALERGLSISEYGVFELAEGDETGPRVAGETEEGVYASVGLPWIPPELREERGEIEAAAAGSLPRLVTLEDLRGDLQMHSTWSDGKNSIEEMLEACAERGYAYLALTDHSQALAMTGGLDAAKLREQWVEIEEVAARHPEIRLLRSLEVDILADGSLDLEDEMLEGLDVVVASVHSRFDLPAAEQTARIVRALAHPAVDILAHPTGRLINRRDPFDFDLDAVLECAAERGVAMELNAHPNRLDLRDTHLMLAKRRGVRIAISTDAHRIADLDLMRYGVEQARRAWLEPADVLNALPLDELLMTLGARRARPQT